MKCKTWLSIFFFVYAVRWAFALPNADLLGEVAEHNAFPLSSSRNGSECCFMANLVMLATSVTTDAAGRIYALLKGESSDYTVAKYDRSGSLCWIRRYDGPGKREDFARAIAVDLSGNVYVTGTSYGGAGDYDFATVKHDPEGRQVWAKHYSGPGNGVDRGEVVTMDGEGNIEVVGLSLALDGAEQYVSVKYDAFGKELEVKRLGVSSLPGDEQP